MFEETDNRDAAAILRGIKDRVEDLEQERESQGFVNYLRQVKDTALAADTVSRTVDDSPVGRWGATDDTWGFCQWSGGDADSDEDGYGEGGYGTGGYGR